MKKAGSKMAGTKIEKIMYCYVCESMYVSNRKKKCCGSDLEECGFVETVDTTNG